MVAKTVTDPLQDIALFAEKQSAKIQAECLRERKNLFFDSVLGFDYNMGGVRTKASLEDATEKINAITNGFIKFHLVSHRRLWFEVEGVDKRYILHCANEYAFNTKESPVTNPYRKIANAIMKALKERDEMEQMYKQLIAA